MLKKKPCLLLPLMLLPILLAACGSGGGSTSASSGISSGVLVDPYIVGAQLEEVTADGLTVIQRSARSTSSATGSFSFSNAFSDGSIIRIKSSTRGTHANAPYAGIMKRRFSEGDSGPIVVSPLTTLIANGMTPAEIIQLLDTAGLSGLSENDIFSDPMASLNSRTGAVTAADLSVLQANMAVNTFMEAIQDFDFANTAATPVALADCVAVAKETLSPARYQAMVDGLGTDFTVGDLAQTAVIVIRTIVDDIQQAVEAGNQNVSTTTIEQFMNGALVDVATIAQNFYRTRTGTSGDGGTPTVDAVNGETIFTTNCTDCHSVGTSSSVMNLANDGAAVATKFGGSASHQGNSLTAADIADLAAYLDTQSGTTPPTGSDLYTTECQGCHGTLQASDIIDRTAAGIESAIANVTTMNNLILSADEAQSIATALAAETPPAERTGQQVFDQECATCHAVGSHDTSGTFGDLAGMGTAIVTKIEGNHQSKLQAMTTAELTALADFADTFTPPVIEPPPVERTGQQVFDLECATCHALGSHDTSGTFGDLAGRGTTITSKIEASHQSKDQAMTAAELTALADFADTFPPATSGGSCDSCHGQPPAGDSFPDTAGAHAVHAALAEVGTDCDNCHTGAAHNDWVDLGFPAKWDAESGVATDNGDGTCSNIICHGGKTTPNWSTGSINVNTQCTSCHASGSRQYNSYASGDHDEHGRSCDNCHDADKLASGNHFSGLSTTTFEQLPSSTIKSSLSYNPGTRRCQSCHGTATW